MIFFNLSKNILINKKQTIMDDNGNIFHDDIFIKLEESKIIFVEFVDDFYQTEFYTYI